MCWFVFMFTECTKGVELMTFFTYLPELAVLSCFYQMHRGLSNCYEWVCNYGKSWGKNWLINTPLIDDRWEVKNTNVPSTLAKMLSGILSWWIWVLMSTRAFSLSRCWVLIVFVTSSDCLTHWSRRYIASICRFVFVIFSFFSSAN